MTHYIETCAREGRSALHRGRSMRRPQFFECGESAKHGASHGYRKERQHETKTRRQRTSQESYFDLKRRAACAAQARKRRRRAAADRAVPGASATLWYVSSWQDKNKAKHSGGAEAPLLPPMRGDLPSARESQRDCGASMPNARAVALRSAEQATRCGKRSEARAWHAGHRATCRPRRALVGHPSIQVLTTATK